MEIEEHLVALKVMRLTRPTLASPLPVTCDTKDLPANLLNIALQQDATAVAGVETISVGQFLLLPQSPVNIYLGETFSSYICVHNETKDIVRNVCVKVDLQTSSQRLPLPTNPPVPQLAADDTVNNVIHHEVKELGTHMYVLKLYLVHSTFSIRVWHQQQKIKIYHIHTQENVSLEDTNLENFLVCEVSYHTPAGAPMSFRKFFKIQVLKPLDVKTKFYNAESDDIYLEAQVQNITAGPICLEKVALEASHLFNVTSLNTSGSGESVFGQTTLLQPQASCQFLYCLTPQPSLAADLKLLSGATNIGKLDIVWRSNLGERGRLQTSQLQRMGPTYDDIRLSIIELPNFVYLEKEFNFKCRLMNNCERTVELVLNLENTSSLAWCGVSGRKLIPLAPGTSQELNLCAVALDPGLQSISGIRLQDTFLKRTYKYDELAQVFVIIKVDKSKIDI